MVANLLLAFLGALTGILAARLLGPEDRGYLAALQTPALLLAGLFTLGMGDAVVFFVRRRTDPPSQTIGTCLTVAVVSTSLAGLAAVVVLPFILASAPDRLERLGQLWMLVPVITAFGGVSIMAFRAIDRETVWNLWRLTPTTWWFVSLLIGGSILNGDRLLSVTLVYLGGLFLIAVAAFQSLRRVLQARVRPGLAGWRSTLRYGAPLALAALPQVANARIDQLLLIPFVGAEQLGVYVAAVAFSMLSFPIVSSFGIVLFPRLSALTEAFARRTMLRRYLLPAAVAAGALAVVGVATAGVLLPLLFGEDFEGAASTSRVLIPAGAVLAFGDVVKSGLMGLNATREILVAELVGVGVGVVALLVLVPRFGIDGAAVATLVGYSVVVLGRMLALVRCPALRTVD